ncbi:MAG: VCBS repeat-containing protein [Gemmatimonadaceae bacterium]
MSKFFYCLFNWITAAILFGVWALTAPSCAAQSTSPNADPNTANDVLQGSNYLMRADDLVYFNVTSDPNGNYTTTLTTEFTQNSMGESSTTTNLSLPSYFPTSVNTSPSSGGNGGSMATGRIFDVKNDQIVTSSLLAYPNNGQVNWLISFFDPLTGFQYSHNLSPAGNPQYLPGATIASQLVMGDFNGDHFSDVLFFASGSNTIFTSHPSWQFDTYYSSTPSAPTALSQGPEYFQYDNYGGSQYVHPIASSITTGDFNGDGRDEIAVLMNDGQTIQVFAVDPKSFAISSLATLTLPQALDPAQAAMTAGHFTSGEINSQLVVVGQVQGGNSGISIFPIDFTTNASVLTPSVLMSGLNGTSYYQLPSRAHAFGVQAAATSFFPGSSPDAAPQQLVIFTKTRDDAYIDIGLFDLTGTSSATSWGFDYQSFTDLEINTQLPFETINLENMQIGNFNQAQSSSSTPSGQAGLIPQIAIFFNSTMDNFENQPSQTRMETQIYNITAAPIPLSQNPNPVTDWLANGQVYKNDQTTYINVPYSYVSPSVSYLLPGDLQGNSLRLGNPFIVRVAQQDQPTLVLSLPPMHVDYLTPLSPIASYFTKECEQSLPECLINISVAPTTNTSSVNAFASGLNFQSSGTMSQSSSSTTSWGISSGFSISEEAAGNDAEANVSSAFSFSAQYKHDSVVKKTYSNYSTTKQQVTAATGLGDMLAFTEQQMNIFYYPVIGQFTCTNQTNCQQLYVEFSVPGSPQPQQYADGTNQDWYQPVHEPGNVFSYPANKALLQKEYTQSANPVTTGSCFGVNSNSITSTASWASGSTSGNTVGSSNSFTEDASMSYSAGVGEIALGDGAEVTTTLNFGSSQSLSSLNESTTALSSSLGILTTKPAIDSYISDCCSYGFENYAFTVNANSPSSQNNTVINDPDSGNPVTLPFQGGPLFVGYTAAVTDAGSNADCSGIAGNGTVWGGTYNLPDIGLNHPARWNWSTTSLSVTFQPPDKKQPPNDQFFYMMKGFFVTKHQQATTSPALGVVQPGDDLDLTARVYNYSLAPTTGNVHVRFYGQLFCYAQGSSEGSCLQGCSSSALCGNGFQIGTDQIIQSIPGFEQSATAANWSTATQEFKPADYPQLKNGNLYMVFWVVTWMDGGSGSPNALGAEMPGHGVSSQFDPKANYLQINDIPVESYSNNVGMYPVHNPLYIMPLPAPGSTLAGSSPGALQYIQLQIPSQMFVDQQAKIVASVSANGGVINGVRIKYFDGQPQNGRLIDTQLIAHMEPGVPYPHHTLFVPTGCGTHTLVASAGLPGGSTITSPAASTTITLVPADYVSLLMARSKSIDLVDPSIRSNLLAMLSTSLSAFQASQTAAGLQGLQLFEQAVLAVRGSKISMQNAGRLLTVSDAVLGCTPISGTTKTFQIAASPSSKTVAAGGAASYSVNVFPAGGYSGTLTVTCSGNVPSGICSSTPATLNLSGNAAATATIKITTSAKGISAAGFASSSSECRPIWWSFSLCWFGLAATLSRRARWRATIPHYLATLFVCVFALFSTGCGSASNAKSTPKGSYVLTVMVSDAAITQSTQLKLQVQ